MAGNARAGEAIATPRSSAAASPRDRAPTTPAESAASAPACRRNPNRREREKGIAATTLPASGSFAYPAFHTRCGWNPPGSSGPRQHQRPAAPHRQSRWT